MRENAVTKAARYLAENRVRILECHEDTGILSAEVRGQGSVYVVSHDGDGWTCTCPARRADCAHVLACKAVTVFEPTEAA